MLCPASCIYSTYPSLSRTRFLSNFVTLLVLFNGFDLKDRFEKKFWKILTVILHIRSHSVQMGVQKNELPISDQKLFLTQKYTLQNIRIPRMSASFFINWHTNWFTVLRYFCYKLFLLSFKMIFYHHYLIIFHYLHYFASVYFGLML